MAKGKPAAKRVVYLWGAGATHAEAQLQGSTVSLLMRSNEQFGEGITSRIFRRTERTGVQAISFFKESKTVDIEKLISLLATSGNYQHLKLAEELRLSYFREIRDLYTSLTH